MMQAQGISLAFGDQVLFDDLSFTLQDNQRIGLVGRNGSGKSTLLKILAKQQQPDEGTVSIAKGSTIAYMPQDVVLLSPLSIIDETLSAFADIVALQKEIELLAPRMDANPTQEEIDRYAHAQEALIYLDPDKARARTHDMLLGLGFSAAMLNQPVSTLSTGWKMRVVLAKLLLQDADFYFFDEPTNHLDLIAKEWFLGFLKNAPFGFMLVCHERYVMDELCTTILELEMGKGIFYTGNYTKYEEQKEHNLELLQSAHQLQQKEIAHKKRIIERFKAKASKAKMAQSMARSLDKMEIIQLPPSPKNVSFRFPETQRSGKIVLTVKDVGYCFGEKVIFNHVSFEVERGQKVALIAANGVGKTTLFNVITGQLTQNHGSIIFGYNVHHAIFAQDQTQALDLEQSVLDNVNRACHKASEQNVRSFLGAFLFTGDDVQKKVRVLSGGEKNRVGMVCTLLQGANLLLLDEPTNHLDIPSKRILLKALQDYEGTMLFVSHDRDFINSLATNVIALSKDGAHMYHGNYDAYAMHIQPEQHKTVATKTSAQPKIVDDTAKRAAEHAKKSRSLERLIERIEGDITRTQEKFAEHAYGTPGFKKAEQDLATLQRKLKTAHEEWDALIQTLE